MDPGSGPKSGEVRIWLGNLVHECTLSYQSYKGKGYTLADLASDLGFESSKTLTNAFNGIISPLLAIRLTKFINKPPEFFLVGEPCPDRDREYAAYCSDGTLLHEDAERAVLVCRYKTLGENGFAEMDIDVLRNFVSDVEKQADLYGCKQREINNKKKEEAKMNSDNKCNK